MTEKPEEELTVEELRFARSIFKGFVFLGTLLIVAVNVVIGVGGYLSWPWFLVIPVGGALIFAARVIRRYNRNILDGVHRDIAAKSNEAPGVTVTGERIVRPDMVARVAVRLGGGAVPGVVLAMLCVSAFWYFAGLGMRWLVSLA